MHVPKPPKSWPHRWLVFGGIVALVLAWWFLSEAYEGRGRKAPILLRPISYW